MIVLFTHDKRIEIPQTNPLHDSLLEFDGKFLGVSVVQGEVVEVIKAPVKEVTEIEIDRTAFLEHLTELFDGKTVTFKLLNSHAAYLLGGSNKVSINKDSENEPFKVIEEKSGLLLVPERFVL